MPEKRTVWLILLALVLFLPVGISRPPVSRTQEARVLLTAAETVTGPARNWVIPYCNGKVRLNKPPLAYWVAAVSYEIGGISIFTGRLPFALAAWGTAVIVYLIMALLFDRRDGLLAALVLVGMLSFSRFGRLAETDVLVAFFVTVGVYAAIRSFLAHREGRRTWGWFYGCAIAAGLAGLTKGPVGAYPLLFLAALGFACGQRGLLWRFIRCGAPLAAVAVVAPWYAYVSQTPEFAQVVKELEVLSGGENHGGWFFEYLPYWLMAALPWSAFAVVGVVGGFYHWKADWRVRALMLWQACILIPLFFTGNKQPHYLVPLMPSIAALVGWLVGTNLRPDAKPGDVRLMKWLLIGSTVAAFVGAVGVLVFSAVSDQGILTAAIVIAAIIFVGGGVTLFRCRDVRLGSFLAFAFVAIAALSAALFLLLPPMNDEPLITDDPNDLSSVFYRNFIMHDPLEPQAPATRPSAMSEPSVVRFE